MTHFLLKLLGAQVDDAARITSAALAWRGDLAGGWLLAIGVGLAVLAWWLYRQSSNLLTPLRRRLLTFLRVAFLALILLLLLRPVLALTIEGSIRRVLVLLVDDSASMQIKDPRLTSDDQKRAGLADGSLDPAKGLKQNLEKVRPRDGEHASRSTVLKEVLKNPRLNLLPRLEQDYDLHPYKFGQIVSELPRVLIAATNTRATGPRKTRIDQYEWVNELNPEAPLTAVGDATRDVLNRTRGQPLAGIVLVTDGANNSGSQPREIAALLRQEGIPVYVYGVGITSPRDIILANLFAPKVSFVRDEVSVTVRVRSQGLKGEAARLRLQLGDNVVAQKDLVFTEDGEQVIPLQFTPQATGEFDLTASIEARADETVTDNNSRSQRIKVIDARIKVLLVDQSPRWEYRYLQAMLERDRRVDLNIVLMEGDPGIVRSTNSPFLAQFPARMEELFKYDLVVFGDVDPRRLPPGALENLGDFVSKAGGSVVVQAGRRFTPTAYRRTVLEKMLPVELDRSSFETPGDGVADKPIRLELTASGRASAMMRLSDKDEESAALWKQLPPVYWVARVARAKPAAEVLLVDPDPSRETRFGKMPVIALQQYGAGQVLYVGTDNTWRWRRNVGDIYFTAIWGQIAQRLSLAHLLGGSRLTQLSTDRENYVTGDRVTVFARLYLDRSYEAAAEDSIKGTFGLNTGGRRSEVTLRSVPEQPGMYRGEFTAPAPGQYEFALDQDAQHPLEFTVTDPRFELGETAMNEALLRELAQTTRGGFFREETLNELPEEIRARTDKVRSPLEIELWSSPIYFLLLLGVVSAEWWLRKRSHLK